MVKYTLQHSQVRLIFWAKYRFITHQPVFARGWLLKACLVERVDPGERERFGFPRVRKFQLIDAATELLTLCVQKFCQPCVAAGLQKGVVFFIRQAEIRLQGHTIRLRLVPLFHAGIYLGKRTRAIQIPIPERHYFRCFPSVLPERKLPVVKALIIRIPCQPAALQSMLSRHEVDFRRAFLDVNVPILIHVLRLNDLLCAVLFEEREQPVQLGHVVRPSGRRKGAVHQRMADVSLE